MALVLDGTSGIFNLLNLDANGNLKVNDTDAIVVPVGTTAERPANPTPGMLRFNTTLDQLEQYTSGSGWQGISAPPTVIGTDVTNILESDTSQVIVITGQNFDSASTGLLVDANGVSKIPTTSVRDSSSQITITYSGNTLLDSSVPEPLDVKVVNGSGLSATLEDYININATPTWNTASGSLGTVYNSSRSSYSTSVSATDPEGGTLTYSIVSGAVPTGMTLNSNGTITGTPAAVGSNTTYNFTVRASDGNNTTDRAFSITINAPVVTTYSYTGSDQTFSVPGGVTTVEMYLWGAAGGGGNGEGYSDKGGPGGATIVSACTVTPGDTLKVQVGQGGWNSGGTNGPLSTSRPYPWGGRPSPRSGYSPAYGGGRSAVFKSNTVSAANCLAVAGGGGGSGGLGWAGTLSQYSFCGGSGGGETGNSGHYVNNGDQWGTETETGGTQTRIGNASSYGAISGGGVEAAQFKGGDNANPEGTYSSHGGNTGGGGGDGWYGGKASRYAHSGGGGGSGYVNPTFATGLTYATAQTHVNRGDAPSNPPQTGNTYYGGSAGVAVDNGTGNNGRVVIVY